MLLVTDFISDGPDKLEIELTYLFAYSIDSISNWQCLNNLFKAYWLRDAPTSLTFKNRTLCPHRIYVFCSYMRTNSDVCLLHHKLIGFYNRDEKCLLRGTNWAFE